MVFEVIKNPGDRGVSIPEKNVKTSSKMHKNFHQFRFIFLDFLGLCLHAGWEDPNNYFLKEIPGFFNRAKGTEIRGKRVR